MRLLARIGIGVLTFIPTAVLPAAADPVTVQVVTFGDAFASEGNNGFVLIGEGFQLRGELPTLGNILGLCFASPCFPGRDLSLDDDATPHVSSVNAESVVFEGVDYEDVFLTGDLIFRGGAPIIVPEVPEEGFVYATAPFTFTGRLPAFDNVLLQGNPLFTAHLTGAGTATVGFTRLPGVGIVALDVTYQFEAPAAVPEPASLLLVGSGIAALAARRRRRIKDA